MNLKILIPKKLKKKINKNTYWIVGPARSGTSIIGNLIASFKKVEYFYEPDLFRTLFAINSYIKKKVWEIIFDTYFYIDLIKNSLNKRSVNFNKKDQFGYYFKYKEKKDLILKNYFDIFEKNINFDYKIFIKLPSSIEEVDYISKKKKFNIIYIKRNDLDIISSLVKKKWFSINSNRFFPAFEHKNKIYPYFLKKKEFKNWDKLDEYNRCAIYLLRIKKSLVGKKNITILDYDELLNSKRKFFKKLKNFLKLKPSKKTLKILKNIKQKKTDNNWIKDKIDKKILKKLQMSKTTHQVK